MQNGSALVGPPIWMIQSAGTDRHQPGRDLCLQTDCAAAGATEMRGGGTATLGSEPVGYEVLPGRVVAKVETRDER